MLSAVLHCSAICLLTYPVALVARVRARRGLGGVRLGLQLSPPSSGRLSVLHPTPFASPELALLTRRTLLRQVGKSCIVLRFVRGSFDPKSKVTVGAAFLSQVRVPTPRSVVSPASRTQRFARDFGSCATARFHRTNTLRLMHGPTKRNADGLASRRANSEVRNLVRPQSMRRQIFVIERRACEDFSQSWAQSLMSSLSCVFSLRSGFCCFRDTAGQERYASLAPLYYRGASAACVVFDLTNGESFRVSEQSSFRWAFSLQLAC